MPDNPNEDIFNEDWDENPNDGEDESIPASVIFTEMMRRAASKPRPTMPRTSDYDDGPAEFDPQTVDLDSPYAPPPAYDPTASEPHGPVIASVTDGYSYDPPRPVAEDVAPPVQAPQPVQGHPAHTPPQAAEAPQAAHREAAMEAQRIRRIKRRKERRRRRRVGTVSGFVWTVIVILLTAGLISTIFTFFTDPRSFKPRVVSGIQVADATSIATYQPTEIPSTPNWLTKIGIVSGHRGPGLPDPGAVCDDGLTEAEINFNVAQLVVRNLRGMQYDAELLDEFDPRLEDYKAAALVSIHSNTCFDYGEVVSGFMVAKAAARPEGGPDTQLAECIATHYGGATQLDRRTELTEDMTNYHSFREIHSLTPAAIIELGFMLWDRDLLVNEPDLLAQSITEGILCFIDPQQPVIPVATALPESAS